MKFNLNKSIISLSLLSLSACVQVPNVQTTPLVENPALANSLQGWANDPVEISPSWWGTVEDASLELIIKKAILANKDISIAKLNLEKALMVMDYVRTSKEPTLSFNGSFQREKLSAQGMYPPPYAGSVIELGQIGLGLRYSVDYLEKTQKTLSEQDYKNSAVSRQIQAIELTVSTQVAKLYAALQFNLAIEDSLKERLLKLNQINDLTKKSIELGLSAPASQRDVEQQILAVSSDLQENKSNTQVLLSALKNLTQDPELEVLKKEGFLGLSLTKKSTNLNISVVRARPDVAYWFDLINAQKIAMQALKVDFYPSVSLSADLGLQKVGFDNLLNKKATFWTFGPSLSLPIFDAGKLTTNYKIAGFDASVLVESYNKSILQAVAEINESAIKCDTAKQQIELKTKALQNSQKTVLDQQKLLELGKSSKMSTLKAELAALVFKDQAVQSKYNYIIAQLDVIKAVGGN